MDSVSPTARTEVICWKLQEDSSQVIVEKDFPTNLSQNTLCMLSLVVMSFLCLVAIKKKLDDCFLRSCQWNLSSGLGQDRERKEKINQEPLKSPLTQKLYDSTTLSKLNFCCLGVRYKFTN